MPRMTKQIMQASDYKRREPFILFKGTNRFNEYLKPVFQTLKMMISQINLYNSCIGRPSREHPWSTLLLILNLIYSN